ncbi:Non-catalytic module family DOC2, partial [Piromyces sp. E2]
MENGSTEDLCWSIKLGYPCCTKKTTTVSYTEKTGEQYGIEHGQWCGINDLQLCPSGNEYKCCKGCEVVFTDSQDWGIENGNWCSIPYSCK